MNIKTKKHEFPNKIETTYFTEGHVDISKFLEAMKIKKPKLRLDANDVLYLYSDIDRGMYGIGRRFWCFEQEGYHPVTAVMPAILRDRFLRTLRAK